MQVNINELEYCKIQVNYEANADDISSVQKEVLKAFKKAPCPGFRPGKATVAAIKKHYSSQINEALKRALTEDAYHNAIFEKNLRVHGNPKINSALLVDGKFMCEFELHVKPEVNLQSIKDLEVIKPHSDLSSNNLTEEMLQNFRVRFGDTIPYTETDFVQVGDNVILDYEGYLDGQKVDSLSAQGELLTVGSSQLKEFDENLYGMTIGESRTFNLTVPDNSLPSMAGKVIQFTVTLTMGSKIIPCALSDELALKMNKANFQELREQVQNIAEAKVAEQEKRNLSQAIAAKLIETHDVVVPDWMSLAEAKMLCVQAKLEWDTLTDVDKEGFLKLAAQNVKLSLIFDKIREEEPEAQLSEQEVFDMIKNNLANVRNSAKTAEEMLQELVKSGYLQVLSARVKDEYVMDFVIKTIKIIEN